MVQSVGSLVTADQKRYNSRRGCQPEEKFPCSGVVKDTPTPHNEIESSVTSLKQCCRANKSACEAGVITSDLVPHQSSYVADKTSVLCALSEWSAVAMGSPNGVPIATESCLRDFCVKGISKLKDVSQIRLCIDV